MKNRELTSIFLWGLGIASVDLFFTWLRTNYLDLSLNPTMGEVLYFMPHISAIIFGGIVAGMTTQSNQYSRRLRLNPFQQPFSSVWIGALIFSIAFSLWTARSNHFMSNRSYLVDAFSGLILSLLISVFWIVIPFFIGYLVTTFIQYVINFMHHKKQY